MTPYVLCLVTIDNIYKATEIANTVVTERLAACVNILPGIRSIYQWKGAICDESEHLLFIKTSSDTYSALETRIRDIHPYEVPEIIAITIEKGLPSYLSWIDECLSAK